MRSSRALTGSALFVLLAGTAACGVASVAPKVQLRDAFGALADARTGSFTVSLPSSEKDVRAFLSATGEDQPSADNDLSDLLDSSIVVSYDTGQSEDATDDAGAFQLRIGGETYGEMRFVDQVAYARVDTEGLSDRFPELEDGLDEFRDELGAQDLGDVQAAADAALDGDWVSLDVGEGSWFAQQQQAMEDAGSPPADDVRQQLLDIGKKAFESSVSLRSVGSDDIGDRMIVKTNTRELYTDLADELPDLLAGYAPGAEEELPSAEEVPDVDVQALIWLDDGKLRRFELDLAQFLEKPAGHMVLRVDVADGDPIEAPDDAVPVDMEQLAALGAAASENTDYAGAPSDVGAEDAAYAVDSEFQFYASTEGVAPTIEHLPKVAEAFADPVDPIELVAVGDRVQVTYAGETACLTLGPDADTPGTVTPGPC
jgi:hypothetical protein